MCISLTNNVSIPIHVYFAFPCLLICNAIGYNNATFNCGSVFELFSLHKYTIALLKLNSYRYYIIHIFFRWFLPLTFPCSECIRLDKYGYYGRSMLLIIGVRE